MMIVDEFLKALQSEVDNNSIYVWGGQGEMTRNLAITNLERMETSKTNVKRILKHVADIYDASKGLENSRAFDCSGLLTYHLLRMRLITSDTTADGLLKKCTKINKKDLRPGDFVFKVNNEGRAVHVACYKGDGVLIEAVGRDEGVKNTKLTTKFNRYGRLKAFE